MVRAVWDALASIGIGTDAERPDVVLDPSCGIGGFEAAAPAGAALEFHMVELDKASADIAAALGYGTVVNAGYEETVVPAGRFDAAVTNVPFDNSVSIERDGRSLPIHDWFLERMVDDVVPGGVVCAITSRWTMDKANSRLRRSLASRAELVAAVRLPRETFAGTAGTEAVSDVLVFRKRRIPVLAPEEGWVEAVDVPADEIPDGLVGNVTENPYFRDDNHPDRVVGKMSVRSGPFGPTVDVTCGELGVDGIGEAVAASLKGQLAAAGITNAHDGMERSEGALVTLAPPKSAGTAEYVLGRDGTVWVDRAGGELEPVKAKSPREMERLARMVTLVRLSDELKDLEAREGTSDESIRRGIEALNKAYDGFVERYGRLCEPANKRAYGSDVPSRTRLFGLERLDGRGRFQRKADLFERRIVHPAPPVPEHVDDAMDALAISLDQRNGLDIAYIASLLGTDEETAYASLGGAAIRDPDTGRVLEAAQYLSGDVQGKLDHVEGLIRRMTVEPARKATDAWLESIGVAPALSGDFPDEVVNASGYTNYAVACCQDAMKVHRALVGDGTWRQLVRDDADTARFVGPVADRAVEGGRYSTIGTPGMVLLAHALMADLETPLERPELKSDGYHPLPRLDYFSLEDELKGRDLFLRAWASRTDASDLRGLDTDASADVVLALSRAGMLLHMVTSPHVPEGYVAAAVNQWLGRTARDVRAGTVQVDPLVGALYRLCNIKLPLDSEGRVVADGVTGEDLERRLREDPAVLEYLLSLVADAANDPTWRANHVEYRAYRNRSVKWEDAYGPEVATDEGLEAFRERRASFFDAMAEEGPDEARLAELRETRDRLTAALPARLNKDQVSVSIASPVVTPALVAEFVADRLVDTTSTSSKRHFAVTRDEVLGSWTVSFSGVKPTQAAEARFGLEPVDGTNGMAVFRLLENALNNGKVEVTRSVTDPETGKIKTVRDPRQSLAAWEKKLDLDAEFTKWLWEDEGRAAHVLERYNRMMNGIAPRHYDGSYLTLPGQADDIALMPHQKDAVSRVLRSDEGTLLAHVVGAGKTFSGIAAIHESKRLGRCSKPMVAVPNGLVGQWAAEWTRLYPQDRVLVMDASATSSLDAQQNFWGLVQNGEWDAVIVPQSRFDAMTLSPDEQETRMSARISELEEKIRENPQGLTVKKRQQKLNRERKRFASLHHETQRMSESAERTMTYFDDLGVDFLMVDEAHGYKNLDIDTTIGAAGVINSAARKSTYLLDKCDWLRERGHGSNIVFATGTPVTNSMSELWVMERYLTPGLLASQGTLDFDRWAGNFGVIMREPEIGVDGAYILKDRFSRYTNLPELMSTFHCMGDVITNDDIELRLPEVEIRNVVVDRTPEQEMCMKWLERRGDLLRDPSKSVDPSVDNMLKITGDGKKVALDPKLLFPEDDDIKPSDAGKIAECAKNVYEVWRDTTTDPSGEVVNGTQLVFCDSSTDTTPGRFDAHTDLVRRLVEYGIPRGQIATMAEATNANKAEALFNRVRSGEVRVLIGSTARLGTGVSVQQRLAATHDLDCPWRSSDLEQRLGRIQRQGNMFATEDWWTPRCYRYATEGTFDTFLYQTVERKGKFVAQIMTNDSPAREASELNEVVLTLAEMKALATGDESLKRRLDLTNRISTLKMLKSSFASDKQAREKRLDDVLRPKLASSRAELADLEGVCPLVKRIIDARPQARPQGAWDGAVVGSVAYAGDAEGRKAANAALWEARLAVKANETLAVGRIGDLDIRITYRRSLDGAWLSYLSLADSEGHAIWAGTPMANPDGKGSAAVTQLMDLIGHVETRLAAVRNKVARDEDAVREATEALKATWPREQELAELERELATLPPEVKVKEAGGVVPTQDFIHDFLRGDFGDPAEVMRRTREEDGQQEAPEMAARQPQARPMTLEERRAKAREALQRKRRGDGDTQGGGQRPGR